MEHFTFRGEGQPLKYANSGGGGPGKGRAQRRDSEGHGRGLQLALEKIDGETPEAEVVARDYYDGTRGRMIHFEIDYAYAGADPQMDEFGGSREGIELVHVVPLGGKRFRITLYVPFAATNFLIKQVQKFVETKGTEAKRWASIESVEEVTVRSLYHDDPSYFPEDFSEVKWFELWIVKARRAALEPIQKQSGFELAEERLEFRDRLVVLARISPNQLIESHLINIVAEVNKPTFARSIAYLHSLPSGKQYALLDKAAQRILEPNRRVRVAMLDSGVTIGHPLLEPVVQLDDVYDATGGNGNDQQDHGTGIASLILFGERLERDLAGDATLEPSARLESVCLLDEVAANSGPVDPVLLGNRTARACYLLPLLNNEQEQRVFVSTVTDSERCQSGKPDPYSAALDSLAYGKSPIPDDIDLHGPKLILQSGGNSVIGESRQHIERPAQAWNIVTVGAYTRRPGKRRKGTRYLAEYGSLSPSSSHGAGYEARRALKPDIVMEGGNAEDDGFGSGIQAPDCMVLGASAKFPSQYFSLLDGTSSAAGLAGNLAAKIWARYPALSPNSVRALLVNSARWTTQMVTEFRSNENATGYEALVQQCGMGVPNAYLATDSEQSFVTMVFEDSIAPFATGGRNAGEQRFDQFHLIRLPWPVDTLKLYARATAEMRVTLAHFIEPNPTNREYASRYKYESHGLRFRFKRRNETQEQFCARISKELETEENKALKEAGQQIRRATATTKWKLGPDLRSRGSIHSDLWVGGAQDLAEMSQVAVFPVSGWWRYNLDDSEHGKEVEYSLALSVTIRDHSDAELYMAVRAIVEAEERPQVSVDA